jgi:hypothetical protein
MSTLTRRLAAHGLSIEVFPGWDVRIERREQSSTPAPGSPWPVGGFVHPVLHAATSTLPPDRGDYGSGYVETMRPLDVFVALVEFDHEAGDTAMFDEGLPTALQASEFHPEAQQRVIPGMCGSQRFFAEHGRAFCLYVVLGSWVQRHQLVQAVNRLVATIRIDPLDPLDPTS